jgi:cysteine-rich repeat protein
LLALPVGVFCSCAQERFHTLSKDRSFLADGGSMTDESRATSGASSADEADDTPDLDDPDLDNAVDDAMSSDDDSPSDYDARDADEDDSQDSDGQDTNALDTDDSAAADDALDSDDTPNDDNTLETAMDDARDTDDSIAEDALDDDPPNTDDMLDTDEPFDTDDTSADDSLEPDGDLRNPVSNMPEEAAPAECGNGVVEAGEACDDGNGVDSDDCSNACTIPGCGDGVVQQPREECDDGNAVNEDGCTNQCRPPWCGDGIVSTGERCDDGNQNDGDGCSASCQPEICGDGIVSANERCDDGNQNDGDGCSATCEDEICGDGITTGREQCDDGNQSSNDGCSSGCLNEFCGDGVVQPGEQCDDMNTVDTDVCRNGCTNAASLNSLSGSCALLNQITQTVCMVATANWCAQYNHDPIAGMVTGVVADNEYSVGCIIGFEANEAPIAQLDQCPGGRQQSPACLEQVHMACVDRGYSRGFYLGLGWSGNTYAIACDSGSTTSESVPGCNGISDTSPVPVTCAQELSTKCGENRGGMIQARAQSDWVTYTCIDLSLTGTARQF